MWIFIFLGLFAGFLMPFQAALNAELSRYLQHPIQASFISFLLGSLSLLLILLGLKIQPFHFAKWPVPAYLFSGGLLGAFFVTSTIFLIARMGAMTMTALFIAGQFLASTLMDHYGLLNMTVRPLTPGRFLGLLFLAAGIALIKGR